MAGLSSELNYTEPKPTSSAHLQSRTRGKGTRLTAILRRSQFSLTAPQRGGTREDLANMLQGYRCKAQPLSREAQAAGHAAHSRRDQVVQVTVGWRRQLPRQPVRRCSFGPPGRLCLRLFRPLQDFNFLHTYPETGGMTCAQLANPNKEADVGCGVCFAPTKQGSPAVQSGRSGEAATVVLAHVMSPHKSYFPSAPRQQAEV